MLSTAPRVISRSGPGVHSAEFNHVSRSGKFDISRSGPGMHSMVSIECVMSSRCTLNTISACMCM